MDEHQALRYLDRISFRDSSERSQQEGEGGDGGGEGVSSSSSSSLPPSTYETLERLILKHLLSIPFENLDLHASGHPFEVTPLESERKEVLSTKLNDLHEKIVCSRRGGICFEANQAFHYLLKAIGYDVVMQICYVLSPIGKGVTILLLLLLSLYSSRLP